MSRSVWRALVLSAGIWGSDLAAQPADPDQPVRRDPLGTLLVNGQTPYTIGDRKLEVLFSHRFHQPVDRGDAHNLWGLDGGADIGIGLAMGLTPKLDVSLFRSSFQENFEIAGKLLLFEQAPRRPGRPRRPMTIAVRAGVDLPSRPGIPDSTRPFAQVLLARQLRPGINLLLSPSWVADTPRLKNAFNVPLGLTFMLPGEHLVEIEVVPENRDLDDSRTAWHVAFSKALGEHVFEIVAGNSRATTVDQMLGGDSAAGFDNGDVRLGFNIVRNFSLRRGGAAPPPHHP